MKRRKHKMAETRRESRTQKIRDQVERAAHETVEEVARTGREQIEAGERTAQSGVDLLHTSFELFQRNVELIGLLKEVSERNIRRCAELLGSASEEAERATAQAARTGEKTTLSNVSSEWIRVAQQRAQRNIEHWNRLIESRTPQEFVNAQSSVFRDNLEDALHVWQMVADRSLRLGGKLAANVPTNASGK
jgi:Phasin protein